MTSPAESTRLVKAMATESGFHRATVAPARALPDQVLRRQEDWLAGGNAAGMGYLHRSAKLRRDPRALLDGARSVICLARAFDPGREASPIVARYAHGRDYHRAMKKRCFALADRLAERFPGFGARAFVDTAPVMERSLAALSGLGWIGRNGLLIAPGLGSWLWLAEVVCTLDLEPDAPLGASCGSCRRCLDACPTGALRGDGLLDARQCMSYWTTDRHELPEAHWPALGQLAGCDRCQEVCPHNASRALSDLPTPEDGPLASLELADVLAWGPDDWDAATRGSTLRRVGWVEWVRRAMILAANHNRRDLADAIRDAGQGRPEFHAARRWALDRLASPDG